MVEKAAVKEPAAEPKGGSPKPGDESPKPGEAEGKKGPNGSHFGDFEQGGVVIEEKKEGAPDPKLSDKKEKPEEPKKPTVDPKVKDGKDGKISESEKKPEPLILGRFKTKEDLKKSIGELSRELGNVIREVGQLERQLGETSVFEDPIVAVIEDSNLESTYQDLERKFTKAGQRRAELRKKSDDSKKPASEEKELTTDEEYDLMIKDPKAYVKHMVSKELEAREEAKRQADTKTKEAEKRNLEEAAAAVAAFKEEHPDFAEHEEEMNKVLEVEIPKNVRIPSAQLLKMAYDIVLGRKTPEIIKKATDAANKDDKDKTKLTETDAGAGAEKGGKEVKVDDKIKEDIVNSHTPHKQFGV
jgi:hypothetical protein